MLQKREKNLQQMKSLADSLERLLKRLRKEIQLKIEEVSSPDDLLVLCSSTNKAIYKIESGKKINLVSHGRCKRCGLDYSEEALYMMDSTPCKWAVEYNGFTCKGCCPWLARNKE
jgi:hypothetical protein